MTNLSKKRKKRNTWNIACEGTRFLFWNCWALLGSFLLSTFISLVLSCVKFTGEKPSSLEHVCYNFLLMTPWSCCCYIIGKRCLSFSVLFNITTPMKETEWCLLVFFFKNSCKIQCTTKVKYCMFTFNFHNDWHFFAIKHDRSFCTICWMF